MYRTPGIAPFTFGCAALLIVGCSDTQRTAPVAPGVQAAAQDARKPGQPGAASDRMLFQVRLGAEGDSHAAGVMVFEIVGGSFTASVQAAGLEPLQRIPQHIHVNPTCNP
jgi:hypothetical protein